MPVGAIIGAVGSVAGAGISAIGAHSAATTEANAAQSAADEQLKAAQLASQTSLDMYNKTSSNLAPYMSTGSAALAQLASLYGLKMPAMSPNASALGGMPGAPGQAPGGGSGVPDTKAMLAALTQTPGYQFGLQQGGQALDRSAASRGLVLSGAQLKDTQEFGTNYAIQQGWNPYVSQLSALSSLGENAGAMVGNAGSAAANQSGQFLTAGAGAAGSAQLAGAQASASGALGVTNALAGGLQNSLMAYQLAHGTPTPPSPMVFQQDPMVFSAPPLGSVSSALPNANYDF